MATYQIITGQDQGKYMRVMGNRESSAFDEDNTAELAYWGKHVMPYVESNDGNIRWWRMKGFSQNWDNDLPPARFVKMTTYTVKRGKMSDFLRFWRNNTKLQKELRLFWNHRTIYVSFRWRISAIIGSRALQ